jgi:hypothetical protein
MSRLRITITGSSSSSTADSHNNAFENEIASTVMTS